MKTKKLKGLKPIKTLNISGSWDDHVERVRPAIRALDRRQAEAMAKAPFIVVTNATKKENHDS